MLTSFSSMLSYPVVLNLTTLVNMYGSIYKITNKVNGKVYIGQTVQKPTHRWWQHKTARNGKFNSPLYCAMRKHGIRNFTFKVIAYYDTKEVLDKYERAFITHYKSYDRQYGYNLELGGSSVGKVSDETKAKISIAHMGDKNPMFGKKAWNSGKEMDAEWRENCRKAMLGKHMSTESRRKIGIASTGRKQSAHTIKLKKMANAGYRHTKETKEKNRLAHLGRPAWNKGKKGCFSKLARLKMSRAHIGKVGGMSGKKHTDATKQKISKAHKGRKPSKQAVAKIKAALLKHHAEKKRVVTDVLATA